MPARPEGVVDAVAPLHVQLDPVGRVGDQESRLRAPEEPGHVVGARGVAAQEAMVAEHVEVAPLDVGLRGRLGHVHAKLKALDPDLRSVRTR